jgi:succinyl-diaminopimelate desuccinylase
LTAGRIYGRGACDMKGGLAASIIAAEAFIAACPDHSRAHRDQRHGGRGIGRLRRRGLSGRTGLFQPRCVQHVIIPEPLHKDRICLGHRGVWWAEIETKGRIAHGSMPFLGDSAIATWAPCCMRSNAALPPAGHRHTAMPVVPDGARQSTLNINSVHGGEAGTGGRAIPACPRPASPTAAASSSTAAS